MYLFLTIKYLNPIINDISMKFEVFLMSFMFMIIKNLIVHKVRIPEKASPGHIVYLYIFNLKYYAYNINLLIIF